MNQPVYVLMILLNKEIHVHANMQKAGKKKKWRMLKRGAKRLGDPSFTESAAPKHKKKKTKMRQDRKRSTTQADREEE